MYYNQSEFQVKFEWGVEGLRELLPVSDIIAIMNVLSFSTCMYDFNDVVFSATGLSIGLGIVWMLRPIIKEGIL